MRIFRIPQLRDSSCSTTKTLNQKKSSVPHGTSARTQAMPTKSDQFFLLRVPIVSSVLAGQISSSFTAQTMLSQDIVPYWGHLHNLHISMKWYLTHAFLFSIFYTQDLYKLFLTHWTLICASWSYNCLNF